jgi:dipeptidase E
MVRLFYGKIQSYNNMKFLLTSAGITNPSIAKALFDLVGKKSEDTSVVFIPTASNIEAGDKGWLINDLVNLQKQNFKSIDIVDISALEEKIWRPRFEAADVLFFEGGETYYLMEWINRSGLIALIPEYLKSKVYVGVSAGSMAASKDLALTISQIVYEEDLNQTENMTGLNLVDFYFLPHLNSPYFKNLREDFIRNATKDIKEKIYALDDNSALKIIDGNVEVVSEGKWFVINDSLSGKRAL